MTYDITEVCRMLGTTSRTLRFYESKGIITSTKCGSSQRRQYTDEQVERIRYVTVLRTIGLSVRTIAELQQCNRSLKDAVVLRRAEIFASIESRKREIHLLNEALSAIESGRELGGIDRRYSSGSDGLRQIAETCTEAILSGNAAELYSHVSPRFKEYLPPESFMSVRRDAIGPLGNFIEVERIDGDRDYPNELYSFVKYERLGLKIKFVFHGGMIEGLWLSYYEVDK